MPTERRFNDAHLMQLATNTAKVDHIVDVLDHFRKKFVSLEDTVEQNAKELHEKIDTNTKEMNVKLDALLRSNAAQENQLIGASKLAKGFRVAFPYATGFIGWLLCWRYGK